MSFNKKNRSITGVVDGIINLIKKNLIAKTNVTSNVTTSNVVSVENSFHFGPEEEIVLIDNGYNNEGYSSTSHYNQFEYAVVDSVASTTQVVLRADTQGSWYVSDGAFIQKTIGHSPLYEDMVLYGDREIIPETAVAITVEPLSLSNEWLYIRGGLSQEYTIQINVYVKDILTEEGMRILGKYSDAVYDLLNTNIEIDLDNYETSLLANVASGTHYIIIADTANNRANFAVSPNSNTFAFDSYDIQDNNGVEHHFGITSVEYSMPSVGQIRLTADRDFSNTYKVSDFGILTRKGRFIYDSRVSDIAYGDIQKGSPLLKCAKMTWFGKEIREYSFPQHSKSV